MKKALIVLTLAFVIAAPSVAGAQEVETGDFNAQIKTFFNKVFQGEKYEYERKIQTPEVAPSEGTVPSKQERGVPGIEVEAEPGVSSEVRETDSADREIGLPYCNAADVDKHYSLALEYIRDRFDDYGVDRDTNRQVGPCNQGNTAWTAFDVIDLEEEEREIVGRAVVNGDTEEVTFSGSESGKTAPTPDRDIPVEREPGETASAERETSEETGKGMIERVKDFFNRGISGKKDTPAGPGAFRPADEANVSQEVRIKLDEIREEVRNKIREHYEEAQAIRAQSEERIQERKQEFEQRIQAIQNRQKRELANRIHNNIFAVRERVVRNFSNTLDRLDVVAANIETRAEKSETANIEAVKSAVSNAESKIQEARENVKNALREEYAVQGSDDIEILREEFHSVRNQLKNNLESVRNMVRNAHEATRSAAEELTQAIESE